jgi:hypothetical protein
MSCLYSGSIPIYFWIIHAGSAQFESLVSPNAASPAEVFPMPLRSLPLVSSILRLRAVCLLAGFAVMLPAAAFAQVTYTGTAANQNFGTVAIGSTGAAKTFSFSVDAGTAVGSIGVLTQGVPNLDFDNASGGTCAATTYASAATCTVKVTFKPAYAGTRSGAIVFFSDAGNAGTVLGTVFLAGTGSGPQIVYGPVVPYTGFGGVVTTAIDPIVDAVGIYDPGQIAVDAAGTLYVAEIVNDRIMKIPPGGVTPTVIPGHDAGNQTWGVALDGTSPMERRRRRSSMQAINLSTSRH